MDYLLKDGWRGGRFELRNVPNDEPGMSPLEIWCNASSYLYTWWILLQIAASQNKCR